ncbi:MAG TPA: hypothetical protein PKW98_14485, partial [Candidatus Wallbacteria bacterium]|nr:hypothetical protein [Candidatus Wallbacteria bacterium]
MNEVDIEKFKTRFAHNGGETVICENYDSAADCLAVLAGRQKRSETEGVRGVLDSRRRVFLSRSLEGGLALKIKTALGKVSGLVFTDKVSDEADICVASASVLLVQDGALIIDSGRVAHEETLFGDISVLVADEEVVNYDNMARFFEAAAAGRSSVRPDK